MFPGPFEAPAPSAINRLNRLVSRNRLPPVSTEAKESHVDEAKYTPIGIGM